ncbi:MAG: type IV pilin protein [Proteobacteria bacterium]|uniref:type IV pilin protein n=1 Tax=Aquabacterium sp. TaxID=1872578 RepID=UPI0035C6AFF3|nr:type IV pilin protein [Pseudomonadota bacterium]
MSRPRAAAPRGFTLIEVMITVVVVGILAAVAYPSYTAYVARGHRTQVKVQLAAAQQWMERYYSERYFYGDRGEGANATVNTAFASQGFAQSPSSGEGDARYTLGVRVDAGGQGYTLTATRQGTMRNDRCGDPTLTHTGVKGVAGKTGSEAANLVAECWR